MTLLMWLANTLRKTEGNTARNNVIIALLGLHSPALRERNMADIKLHVIRYISQKYDSLYTWPTYPTNKSIKILFGLTNSFASVISSKIGHTCARNNQVAMEYLPQKPQYINSTPKWVRTGSSDQLLIRWDLGPAGCVAQRTILMHHLARVTTR